MNMRTLAESRIILIVLCAGFAVTSTAFGTESNTITFESLLEEMVDRDCLARLPSPAYTCRQFSSYDRNSSEPGSPTWWANWDRSYFHTAWKQWAGIETQSNEKAKDHGAFDLNWITVQGRGLYVGDVLTLFNTANTWWGEGDEKIYVDGEAFPSHIGTGTEDYYGYAWCKPNFFESAFHAQPSGDGNLKPGFTVNVRYRSLDAIPFDKSIRFDMELWHWARTVMNYAPATFWYARPGAKWDVMPNPKEAKRPVPRSIEDIIKPRLVQNAIEGETLPIVQRSGGVTEIQNIPRFRWSNNRQLWWRLYPCKQTVRINAT